MACYPVIKHVSQFNLIVVMITHYNMGLRPSSTAKVQKVCDQGPSARLEVLSLQVATRQLFFALLSVVIVPGTLVFIIVPAGYWYHTRNATNNSQCFRVWSGRCFHLTYTPTGLPLPPLTSTISTPLTVVTKMKHGG